MIIDMANSKDNVIIILVDEFSFSLIKHFTITLIIEKDMRRII